MSTKNEGSARSSCPIMSHLAITPVPELGDGIFKSAHPLWHPPGARGVFGGIAISQSFNAAQSTVAAGFEAHSMHLSFLNAGAANSPIFYQVSELRRSRNYITKFVEAVQNSRKLAISTVSFTRYNLSITKHKSTISHAEPMPKNVPSPSKCFPQDTNIKIVGESTSSSPSPFVNWSLGFFDKSTTTSDSNPQEPHGKRIHQWIKVRGTIDIELKNPQSRTHCAALAYMSDSYFLAAFPHVNGSYHFINAPLTEYLVDDENTHVMHTRIPRPYLSDKNQVNIQNNLRTSELPIIDYMVSLDHTIYFHSPLGFRADDWLLAEIQSNWSGRGRGLVIQKIWNHGGTLVATCVQEGIARIYDHDGKRNRVPRSPL